MKSELYRIAIFWNDSNEETTIICPYDMVFQIVKNLPLQIIEGLKILPNEELL